LSGIAARRIDCKISIGPQPGDAVGFLVPAGEPLAPEVGLLDGELVRGQAGVQRVLLVDPGPKIAALQPGKIEQ